MRLTMNFNMKPTMEHKHITCPCCRKKVAIPLEKYSGENNINYSTLINSTEKFFDLVDVCPKCGYAMLFEHKVSNKIRKYVSTEEYKNILENKDIEIGLRNWILLAMILEHDENYTEAGIAYCKAYDYLELRSITLDKRLIEKSASCFLSAADKNMSFIDAFLAVDSMRRDGEIEQARHFLEITCETFNGNSLDKLTWKEKLWLDLNETEKRYLEI